MAQLHNGYYTALPDNLRQINEYPELKTQAGLHNVIQYITALQHNPNPAIPAEYDIHNFREKFHNTGWRVEIIAHQPTLIYSPPTITARDVAGHPTAFGPPRIRCQVVEPTYQAKQNALRILFNDPGVGIGIGVGQFYHQIASHYIGITFDECNAFLKHQSNYQMTRSWYTRATNRTLLAGSPNERWEVDLLLMTKYSGPNNRHRPLENPFFHTPNPINRNYVGVGEGNIHNLHNFTGSWYAILVAVDVFSNYCFACPVITTTANDICKAMKQICYGQAGCYPRIVQCDNGSEFQTQFRAVCEQEIPGHFGNPHPCDVVHTRPHTPTMNAKVERTNGLLRDRFRAGFVRYNSLEWVRHLADYVYNINHSFPSHPESHAEAHNNLSPAELWTRGWTDHRHEDPVENGYSEVQLRSHYSNTMTPEQIRVHTVARKVYLARLNASIHDNHLYRVGDKVRVSSLAMFNEVKKRHKAGLEDKLNAVKYLPDVYEVIRVRPDVYNGALAHRLNREGVSSYGTHAWDIKKPEYQLQLFRDEGTGHEWAPGDPNRPPPLRRWYYGSYLQRYFDNMTHPSVTTNHRAFQINRMAGHRYVLP